MTSLVLACCRECGREFEKPATGPGRNKLYCSGACRKRAFDFRARARGELPYKPAVGEQEAVKARRGASFAPPALDCLDGGLAANTLDRSQKTQFSGLPPGEGFESVLAGIGDWEWSVNHFLREYKLGRGAGFLTAEVWEDWGGWCGWVVWHSPSRVPLSYSRYVRETLLEDCKAEIDMILAEKLTEVEQWLG